MRRLRDILPVIALLAPALLASIAQAPSSNVPPPAAPAANPQPNPASNSGAAAANVSTLPAIQALRPALDNVKVAIAGLNIPRWKAPGDVRSSTQEDVDSIERDLNSTLPPLLDQAQAPGALAPSFALYRNIDALYDVLLRVAEMSSLAGTAQEASHLEDARAGLEAARGQLGSLLLQSVTAEDSQVVQLRTALAAQARSKPAEAAPVKIVVDDGPAPKPKPRSKPKKRPPAKAPASAPSKAPASTPPQ